MASQSQPIVIAPTDDGETDRLFREWRKPLERFLVCSGITSDGAPDIVQEVFLRLHQHVQAGGERDNLRAWVFRVAHNLAVNGQKRKGHSPLNGVEEMPCADGDPERIFFKKDRFRRLHAAMKELSPVERECIVLRSEGLRYREIAAVLEIGTSTVADHLERALRKLEEKCNV